MALTFPLTRAAFQGTFLLAARQYELTEASEMTETAGGVVLFSNHGTRLWRGSFTLVRQSHAEARRIAALVHALQTGGRTFECFDPVAEGPAADPGGATLGASTVTVYSKPSAGSIRLQGLPAGYVLTAGDRFTVTTDTGRIVLHELTEGATAGAGGIIDAVEVQPPLPASVAADDAVTLIRPFCMAQIVPGSFRAGTPRRGRVTDIGFDWVQRLP